MQPNPNNGIERGLNTNYTERNPMSKQRQRQGRYSLSRGEHERVKRSLVQGEVWAAGD